MWTCPNCGESHHDQFKECWKCVGAELIPNVPAPIRPARPERKLRSLGSILFRAAIGFVVGTLLGVAIVHRNGVSLAEATSAGLMFGMVSGGLVGVFVWVFFPYDTNADQGEGRPEGDAANRFG
jgi:hypothetical protein